MAEKSFISEREAGLMDLAESVKSTTLAFGRTPTKLRSLSNFIASFFFLLLMLPNRLGKSCAKVSVAENIKFCLHFFFSSSLLMCSNKVRTSIKCPCSNNRSVSSSARYLLIKTKLEIIFTFAIDYVELTGCRSLAKDEGSLLQLIPIDDQVYL